MTTAASAVATARVRIMILFSLAGSSGALLQARSRDQQDDAPRERGAAQDRRKRNRLLGILGGLDGPEVNDLLPRRVPDPLLGDRGRPQHAQPDPNDPRRPP